MKILFGNPTYLILSHCLASYISNSFYHENISFHVSSFQNAVLLCKRSLNYLKASKESFKEGLYDVSSTNCQISAELLIKSTYLLLG
ncbi:HEPN domain-containing protein, partial [Sulfuracidifex metallicus]|uniref:HEPN domain-containing protein n=1 Tax=Sulfuracidifex metallicus TaxID=47303 RepID=UPI0012ED27CD